MSYFVFALALNCTTR